MAMLLYSLAEEQGSTQGVIPMAVPNSILSLSSRSLPALCRLLPEGPADDNSDIKWGESLL
eukprot:330826-Hanusia_phi.AAC.1